MRFKHITCVGIALLYLVTLSEGCSNGGLRRKKRSVTQPTAPELFEDLADFFGECDDLVDAVGGMFNSFQSVVDYTIRDSEWYGKFSTSLCDGINDNAQCWKDALKYLIQTGSALYSPAGNCIDQWFESENDKRRRRRNAVYRTGMRPTTKCIFGYWISLYSIYARQTTQQPLQCAACRSKNYQSQYPSLTRFDGPSIVKFLEDHYTYCRLDPQGISYRWTRLSIGRKWKSIPQFSPTSKCLKTGNAWRTSFNQLFTVATRSDGPLWASYKMCPR